MYFARFVHYGDTATNENCTLIKIAVQVPATSLTLLRSRSTSAVSMPVYPQLKRASLSDVVRNTLSTRNMFRLDSRKGAVSFTPQSTISPGRESNMFATSGGDPGSRGTLTRASFSFSTMGANVEGGEENDEEEEPPSFRERLVFLRQRTQVKLF